MRKLIILLFFILISTTCVHASDCTKYLVDLYSKEYNCPVKIVSRQEFVNKYEQKFGEYNLKSIVYGFGFMKRPKCRRVRITYIALMDENCKPVWGYVMPR